MKVNVTEYPIQMGDPDEPTLLVDSFFGTKRVTRAEFVRRWVEHAQQLLHVGVNVTEETERKAGETFDLKLEQQK